MLNKNILSIFFLLILYSLEGGAFTPPPGFQTVNDIVLEFRNPLNLKIRRLTRNYITRRVKGGLFIYTDSPMKCMDKIFIEQDKISSIYASSKYKNGVNTEIYKITGCGDEHGFIETIKRKTSKPISPNLTEFFRGNINIDFRPEDSELSYTIKDSFDKNLFTLFRYKKYNETISTFTILDEHVLTIVEKIGKEHVMVNYILRPLFATYKYYSYKTTFNFIGPQRNYLLTYRKDNNFNYTISSPDEGVISPVNFQQRYISYIANGSFKFLQNSLINAHLFPFPNTNFQNLSIRNDRFSQELRLIFTKLSQVANDPNIIFVKQLISNIINSIQNNLLEVKDHRQN